MQSISDYLINVFYIREANTSRVLIPGISAAPLDCLVHHLTGCNWCLDFAR